MRNKFDDRLFGGNNAEPQSQQNINQFPFYEDHHDTKGNFINSVKQQPFTPPVQQKSFYEQPKPMPQQAILNQVPTQKNVPPYPNRSYNNLVVFVPQTPDDVQVLIDYLKRKEAAIINLDGLDANRSQRILDMVSGAVYALNGSILRIAEHVNIFMLTPEGVVITAPKY